MKREEIYEYVKKQYGTIPEYLWKSSPESAILRHKNGKWYAAILRVEKSKLGFPMMQGETSQRWKMHREMSPGMGMMP